MALNLADAVRYHYEAFPPKELDYAKMVHNLVKATEAISRYDQMLRNMHNSEILLAPLRNQEAVISSRIEGTISTMDEILEFEADEGDDESKGRNYRSDVYETLLYQRALKNAQRAMSDGYELSTSFIKTIHQQLLSFGRGAAKAPGQFKTEQNYLADKLKKDVRFIPISPEKLRDGMEVFLKYLHESSDPVLVKTALMHVEFESLHPFQDGNGRIGRMLITLYLWHVGLISAPHFYISRYMEEHKDEYIDAMRAVSQRGAWEEWCNFFLQAVAAQAISNLNVAEDIRKLYEEMKLTFAAVLSSKWSVHALDFVFTNPVFRNNRFTNDSGIPPVVAKRFSRTLLEQGLIVQKQPAAGRRSALYSFEPLMRLVRV